MAILEKEVSVSINQRNINHFKNLGYDTRINEEKLVKIEHLFKGSKVKVTKICDNPNCDVEGGRLTFGVAYQNVLRSRLNNEFSYDLCVNCGKTLGWEKRKNNIKYENSLSYWAKQNNKEYLLDQWSINNSKDPSEVSFSTLDKYKWNCPKCKSEYSVTVSTRTNNDSACPFCHGKAVNHTNCLWTTHHDIAKLLANPDDGYKYTKASHMKVNWICPDCNSVVKNKSILNITYRGLSCPKCSDGYSYPEKFIFNILDQSNINFEFQKIFDWSNNKKYDFYISSLNTIIEAHGEQHYRYTGFARTLEEEQENDRLKRRLALKNGINHYIVIDCRYSELEWIKNKVLTSELNKILDLNNINWITCNDFATSSLVKIACKLFNKGKSTSEIMKILKLSRFPILKYLKQGNKLGWCDYDPKEEIRKSNNKHKGASKAIVMISTEGNFIEEFESATEAGRRLGINSAGISSVCTGKRNLTFGYRFMFKDDYEEYISKQSIDLIHN